MTNEEAGQTRPSKMRISLGSPSWERGSWWIDDGMTSLVEVLLVETRGEGGCHPAGHRSGLACRYDCWLAIGERPNPRSGPAPLSLKNRWKLVQSRHDQVQPEADEVKGKG